MSELNGTQNGHPAPDTDNARKERARKARLSYLRYKPYVQACTEVGLTPGSLLQEKDREAWDLLRDAIQNGHLSSGADMLAAIDAGAPLESKYDRIALILEEVIHARLLEALSNPQTMRPIEYRGVVAALVETYRFRRALQAAPGSAGRPLPALLDGLPSLFGPIDTDSLDAPPAPPEGPPASQGKP